MTILGIETSCDETSMAIIKNDKIIAHYTTTSSDVQATYGGVVPEVASRYHLKNIHNVFLKVLEESKIDAAEITHIVFTNNPGLPGCLYVGKVFAKTLASIINAELVPINHLYGHIFSAYIESGKPLFPMLSVVISGGHSSIYLVNDFEDISVLNETQDDALGEVYDKVARVVGWNYPGGPVIDKNYDDNKTNLKFMQPMSAAAKFSFSGLKTSIINYVHNKKQLGIEIDPIAVASSFQKFAIDDVMKKVKYALSENINIKCISLGGGVSANSLLRSEMQKLNIDQIDIPLLKYTGDQAAMIAFYGNELIKFKKRGK